MPETLKRLAEYALTLMVIISLNFALPRMMPGDPFMHFSGAGGEVVQTYTAEQRDYFRAYYGLDRPLKEQFITYIVDLSRGNLGYSYYYKEKVGTMILRRLPWTLLLVFSATALSLAAGLISGSYAAWRRGQKSERALYLIMVVLGEIPAFLVGLVLLIILAAGLGWFPLAGAVTHFARFDSPWQQVTDILYHAALPVLTLALARSGSFFLLIRNSLANVLTRDYMLTARAKGLSKWKIRWRHAMRNAMLPLITRTAMQVGAMVGGAVLVENVFNYPGIGKLMHDAVFVRDYPLLQGIFLVLAVTVIAANLAADLLYRRLDPRLKN